MKTKIQKTISVLAAVMTMTAMSSCFYAEIARNKKNLQKIRVGMTKQQVIKIMGEPIKGQTYCTDNTFFYYTHQEWMDGLVTRDECTPIAFDERGRVKGWGKEFNTGVYDTNTIRIQSNR